MEGQEIQISASKGWFLEHTHVARSERDRHIQGTQGIKPDAMDTIAGHKHARFRGFMCHT